MPQPEPRYALIPRGHGEIVHATRADTLADVLERVLDKGVVIAGDIAIRLMDIELLTIHLRLLVASVEKAKEMGIDWWEHNPFLSPKALEREEKRKLAEKEEEIKVLKQRIEQLSGVSVSERNERSLQSKQLENSIPDNSHNQTERNLRRRRTKRLETPISNG